MKRSSFEWVLALAYVGVILFGIMSVVIPVVLIIWCIANPDQIGEFFGHIIRGFNSVQ